MSDDTILTEIDKAINDLNLVLAKAHDNDLDVQVTIFTDRAFAKNHDRVWLDYKISKVLRRHHMIYTGSS